MKTFKIVFAAALLFETSYALAVVDFQVSGGQNTSVYKFKDNSGTAIDDLKPTGTDIGALLLLSPWKAPIGLGVAYETGTGTFKDDPFEYDFTRTKMSVALGAWVPSPLVRPFINFKYILSGSETIETKATNIDVKSKGTLTGYTGEVGIGYKFIPKFNMFLSYGIISNELKLKTAEAKVGAVTTTADYTDGEKFTIDGSVISLGFGLSL